jgi:hypothetical protein
MKTVFARLAAGAFLAAPAFAQPGRGGPSTGSHSVAGKSALVSQSAPINAAVTRNGTVDDASATPVGDLSRATVGQTEKLNVPSIAQGRRASRAAAGPRPRRSPSSTDLGETP